MIGSSSRLAPVPDTSVERRLDSETAEAQLIASFCDAIDTAALFALLIGGFWFGGAMGWL